MYTLSVDELFDKTLSVSIEQKNNDSINGWTNAPVAERNIKTFTGDIRKGIFVEVSHEINSSSRIVSVEYTVSIDTIEICEATHQHSITLSNVTIMVEFNKMITAYQMRLHADAAKPLYYIFNVSDEVFLYRSNSIEEFKITIGKLGQYRTYDNNHTIINNYNFDVNLFTTEIAGF